MLSQYIKIKILPSPFFRQKICCGIVYKGRFGEVIIDPRLFKPCCSSKKQNTLVPAQVAPHLPDTLPAPVPEELKETWWCFILNPTGLSMVPRFVSSGRLPPFKLICNVGEKFDQLLLRFLFSICICFLYRIDLFLMIFFYIEEKKKKMLRALVIYNMAMKGLMFLMS